MKQNLLSVLVGNSAIWKQLSGNHLNHAYIISGPKGSGRHTLANGLAQSMVCSSPKGNQPCGECLNCRKAYAHIHPDIITVSPFMEDGKRLNPERAREYHSDAYIAPNEADRKVYLFDQAEELSEAVQNVLLKIIEEGPEYAAFILVVEHSGQLLPTVRSRCEELKLTPVSQSVAINFLSERYPDCSRKDIQTAAEHCEGILGTAIEELEHQEKDTDGLSLAIEFCTALAQRDECALASFMAHHEKCSRNELSEMCEQCQHLLHSAILLNCNCSSKIEENVCYSLSALPRSALFQMENLISQTIQRLSGNAGSGHVLGWLTVCCSELIKK